MVRPSVAAVPIQPVPSSIFKRVAILPKNGWRSSRPTRATIILSIIGSVCDMNVPFLYVYIITPPEGGVK